MTASLSIPPPPRSTGDPDTDWVVYAQWFYQFYLVAVREGGLLRADQQSVSGTVDPDNPPTPGTTTLATAQTTANLALTAATATASLFPALAGGALKVPRINAGETAFEYITAAALLAAGGGVPSTRTLTAGTGLTGGGDLSANRSFAVDFTSVAPASRNLTAGTGLTGGGTLAADRTFAVDFTVAVPATRTLTAGAGLTGGGSLAADRTFAVDFTAAVPSSRTVTAGTGLVGGGTLSGNITISLQTDWGSV